MICVRGIAVLSVLVLVQSAPRPSLEVCGNDRTCLLGSLFSVLFDLMYNKEVAISGANPITCETETTIGINASETTTENMLKTTKMEGSTISKTTGGKSTSSTTPLVISTSSATTPTNVFVSETIETVAINNSNFSLIRAVC
ncbi:hypothetical protein RN001_014152 [Aquatica leii]|uniref:Antifreeze protein n=1 Tax=Aquatica leii TaxID=1421715 RepID=A0AAN7PSL5_9COLE|nr:hypothetical protein RN001_014152 [Aquatica leii]